MVALCRKRLPETGGLPETGVLPEKAGYELGHLQSIPFLTGMT